MKVLIIAGKAQSGKTIARKFLEDHGYEVVVNPPLNYFEFNPFIKLHQKVAFIFKLNTLKDLTNIYNLTTKIKPEHEVKLIGLDVDNQALLRRLKESRRLHQNDDTKVIKSFEKLKLNYQTLNLKQSRFDVYLDTSNLTPNQLRTKFKTILNVKKLDELSIDFISFGFKNGSLAEADYIFDLRILDNPFYYPKLKEKTGLDKPVRDFVLNNKETKEYIKRIINLLDFVIPLYLKDQRQHMIVGIGCTGGQHRSVATVEYLQKYYTQRKFAVNKHHRDLK